MSNNETNEMEKFVEKPIEDYTEEDIKEMFLNMFFWVSENRPDWLEEAISRRKKQLEEKQSEQPVQKT